VAANAFHSLRASPLDLNPLSAGEVFLPGQPGAAHGSDPLAAQISVQVGRTDAAGGDEFHPGMAVRAKKGVEHFYAAEHRNGKELEHDASLVEGQLDFAGCRHAGHEGEVELGGTLNRRGVEPGRDRELRARLLGGGRGLPRENSAGSHQQIGTFTGQHSDDFAGYSCAKGDLDDRQATGQQCVRQGQGLIHSIDGDDGNNADGAQTRVDFGS